MTTRSFGRKNIAITFISYPLTNVHNKTKIVIKSIVYTVKLVQSVGNVLTSTNQIAHHCQALSLMFPRDRS